MEPSGKDGRGGGLALARDRSPDARRAIDDNPSRPVERDCGLVGGWGGMEPPRR